jgi:DNA-binding transcriptional regulator YdaS (Cro superfamily)
MELLRSYRGLMFWLAKRLGMTQQAISAWKQVPAERVPEVEALTNIDRRLLRPDLWEPAWWSEREGKIQRRILSQQETA